MNPEEIPLRDLHLPAMTGWWPLAPGWWVLIGLAACGLLYLLWRAFRKYQHNAARRKALSQLRYLKAEYLWRGDAISLGLQLSELLRRAMIAYAPRDEVAGLTGTSWLEWLDRGLSENAFSEGPGRNIARETLDDRLIDRPSKLAQLWVPNCHGYNILKIPKLVSIVSSAISPKLQSPKTIISL